MQLALFLTLVNFGLLITLIVVVIYIWSLTSPVTKIDLDQIMKELDEKEQG
jgi:hypothetical protein